MTAGTGPQGIAVTHEGSECSTLLALKTAAQEAAGVHSIDCIIMAQECKLKRASNNKASEAPQLTVGGRGQPLSARGRKISLGHSAVLVQCAHLSPAVGQTTETEAESFLGTSRT